MKKLFLYPLYIAVLNIALLMQAHGQSLTINDTNSTSFLFLGGSKNLACSTESGKLGNLNTSTMLNGSRWQEIPDAEKLIKRLKQKQVKLKAKSRLLSVPMAKKIRMRYQLKNSRLYISELQSGLANCLVFRKNPNSTPLPHTPTATPTTTSSPEVPETDFTPTIPPTSTPSYTPTIVPTSTTTPNQVQCSTEDIQYIEICSDQIDNDCDGASDCADTECGCHYKGFGSKSIGGEGGRLMWVDAELGDPSSDSHTCSFGDPCSLRKALRRAEPRVVKVKRGGIIELTNSLILKPEHSSLTFDGYSSPQPGVTIRGNYGFSLEGYGYNPNLEMHDIIINHLRYIGTGDNAGFGLDGQECLAHDIIFDHITWNITSKDFEAPKMVLWYRAEDVTVSNTFFYDAYKGLQISGMQSEMNPEKLNGISVINNVFFAISHRQPILRAHVENVDLINNMMTHYTFKFSNDSVTRIRNMPDEHKVQNVNILNNWYSTTQTSNNAPQRAVVYGEDHGPQDDGGPSTCPEQGQYHSTSSMGNIWISGNVIPNQTCDKYSTIPEPVTRPDYAQINNILPANSLCSEIAPSVGMRYKNEREEVILNTIAGDCNP